MEGRVVEAERVGRVVAGRADRRVMAGLHELRARDAVRRGRGSDSQPTFSSWRRAPREVVAAGLLEADDVAADAIGAAVGAVGDQGVEGGRMDGELPGRELLLVADAADVVAAVALRIEQHRHRRPGRAGRVHAQQRAVAILVPALAAVSDPALRVEDVDDGDAAGDAPALRRLAARIEVGIEEVELQLGHRAADRGRIVLDRDRDETRLLRVGHLRERLLDRLEGLVAVRAGVQEEDHDRGPAGQHLRLEDLARSTSRPPRAPAPAAVASARRRGPSRPTASMRSSLRRSASTRAVEVAPAREMADGEGHEALGIDAEHAERRAELDLLRDRAARIVDHGKRDAARGDEGRELRRVGADADADQLEIVIRRLRLDALDGAGDGQRPRLISGLKKKKTLRAPRSSRDLDRLAVEGRPREGGDRSLARMPGRRLRLALRRGLQRASGGRRIVPRRPCVGRGGLRRGPLPGVRGLACRRPSAAGEERGEERGGRAGRERDGTETFGSG